MKTAQLAVTNLKEDLTEQCPKTIGFVKANKEIDEQYTENNGKISSEKHENDIGSEDNLSSASSQINTHKTKESGKEDGSSCENQMKYIYDVRRSSSISQRQSLNFVGMRSKSCMELNQYNVTDLSQLGINEGCQRDSSLTNNLTCRKQRAKISTCLPNNLFLWIRRAF